MTTFLRSVAVLLSLTAIVIALAGCSGSQPAANTLIYGRGSDADRLDPVNTDNGESVKVIVNIFDTLVRYHDETTELVPGLAESWETSDDHLTWTFHLRSGVKFHDGTPVDAEAVVFSIKRMIDEKHPHVANPARPYRPNYLIISDVTALDKMTIVFTLKQPSPVFLKNLAMFPASIVSPAAVKKLGEKFTAQPVGSGPFRFKSWQRDQQLVLTANDDYWDGRPKCDRVVFVPVQDDETRKRQLLRGEIHIADNLPPAELDALLEDPNITSQQQPGMNVGYLSMQTEKPPLNNVNVRRAIAMAIDKHKLVDIYYAGYAKPAVNMVPATMWGHHDALYEREVDAQFDQAAAKKLLAEAANEAGFSLPLSLELSVMARPRPYMQQPLDTASFIKDSLKPIGIDVEVRPTPNPTHFERMMTGQHELGLIGWSSDNNDPDNFLYTLVDQDNIGPAGQPGNATSRFRSDELHQLLIGAQRDVDTDSRLNKYHAAQELILRNAPVVPLVHTQVRIAQRKTVRGYKLHPTSIVRLRHAYLEAAP